MYQVFKKTVYASNNEKVENITLQIREDSNEIDIYEIIQNNTKNGITEELITEEVDLEYTTIYQNNDQLGKGTIHILQEGRNGIQKITRKNRYENGELISTEQLESKIVKSSIQKIVEIGTANYTYKEKINMGDTVYIAPSTVSVRLEPNIEAEKIITLNQNDAITVKQIKENWYQISYQNYVGWIEKECVKTNIPQQDEQTGEEKSKQELIASLNKNMKLNKSSGLSLEQFKNIFKNDSNDKNKVFQNNAQYFYYAEKQYNINGIFIAAVGIHESGWGTSKISQNKNNLFGYGAYDSSAYDSSYHFNSYAEGIDLIARVFTKYYLNPAGTKIYAGEVASGKYYNGSTLSAVNKRYATDTNWANGVYKWMNYLYHKL